MSDMRRDQHKASNAVCTALLEAGKIGICRGQPLVLSSGLHTYPQHVDTCACLITESADGGPARGEQPVPHVVLLAEEGPEATQPVGRAVPAFGHLQLEVTAEVAQGIQH